MHCLGGSPLCIIKTDLNWHFHNLCQGKGQSQIHGRSNQSYWQSEHNTICRHLITVNANDFCVPGILHCDPSLQQFERSLRVKRIWYYLLQYSRFDKDYKNHRGSLYESITFWTSAVKQRVFYGWIISCFILTTSIWLIFSRIDLHSLDYNFSHLLFLSVA